MRLPFALVLLIALLPGTGCSDDGGTDERIAGEETTCNGLDDDGDGEVDEDAPDSDGDGQLDCYEQEECNGRDDDGDDEIDEGFPDTDGDGVPDCLDSEECDGLDNDGDGEVDEDAPDTDGDGVPDCLDTEECDGLDNDGDGEVDEDFDDDADGDGLLDCLDAEECDGLDNDGDGVADEGFDLDGDGSPDCTTCEGLAESLSCTFDPSTGALDCGSAPAPIAIYASPGPDEHVLRVDMADWVALEIDAVVSSGSGWLLHVANSVGNDGYGGDLGQTDHDSELQVVDGGATVYRNDAGGATIALDLPGAIDPLSDDVYLRVCDGFAAVEATSSTTSDWVLDDHILQIDGNEPDLELGGVNDTLLWVGVNRVVSLGSTRVGAGVVAVDLTLSR